MNKFNVRVIVKNSGGYEIINNVYNVESENDAVEKALYDVSINDGDTIEIEWAD